MSAPKALHYTDDQDSNELLASDPMALIVGLVLYQQVPIEKAFSGPLELQRRLGGPYDAATIAAIPVEQLEAVFRERPALHRFPANMAKRVHAVATYLVDTYEGDPTKLYNDVDSADDVIERLEKLPGFGEYKARVYFGVLSERFDVRPDGWEDHVPDWPSIVDITTPDDLPDLKARKKAWKEASKG